MHPDIHILSVAYWLVLLVKEARRRGHGDGLIALLESRGASPGTVESRYGAEGLGPSLYLADPEGNVIELKGPPRQSESG